MKLNYPKVHLDQNQKVFISFFINTKRIRIYNGKRIGSETNPNSFPINQRKEIGNLLAAEVYSYVNNGGLLSSYRTKEIISGDITDKAYLTRALNSKLDGDLSPKYKSMLRFVYDGLVPYLNNEKLASKGIKSYLGKYELGVSYNTIKRHLNVLINEARSLGMQSNPMVSIKAKKSKAKLHKPYPNIKEILDEVNKDTSKLNKTQDELLNWMKSKGEVSRGDIWSKAKSLAIKERTLADVLRRFIDLNLIRKVTHGVYVVR